MRDPHFRPRPAALAVLICLLAGVAGLPVAAGAEESSVPARLAASSLLLDVTRAGDRLVAVGERGHILLSDDSGVSWRQVIAPTRATLTAVTFAGPRTGWAVGHDAVVLHTADGGETWDLQYADPEFETPLMDVRFADPDTGFAVGAYGLFLETVDGGASWEQRWVTQDELHFNAVLNPAPGLWFMAGEFGGLYRNDDDGQGDWQVLDSPYEGSFFGALSLGDDEFLVFGLQGNLFRSADGGETWRQIETGTTSALVAGTVLSSGRVVIVGLSGAVLVSDDDGQTVRLNRRADRTTLSGVAEAPDRQLVMVGEAGVVRIEPDLVADLAGSRVAR